MLLGLDCDGVMTKDRELRSRILWVKYKIDVEPDLCNRRYLTSQGIFSEDEYEAFCQIIYHDPKYGHLLRLADGAAHSILLLQGLGYSFKIATRRSDTGLIIVRRLFDCYGLSFPMESVPRGKSKAEAIASCYAYVDDDRRELDMLLDTMERSLQTKLYLWRHRYNQDASLVGLCGEVTSFPDYTRLARSWQRG